MNKAKLIHSMLIENTGIAMMDSGGGNGRAWQRNQGKTLQDFENEPQVSVDRAEYSRSTEIEYIISLFHYLNDSNIELDELCNEYNSLPCKDWGYDLFGVSKRQGKWIEKHGFEIGDSFNSYNGQSSLSQIIQGTYLKLDTNTYVLLQIHGGADTRGGYTDAKLFYLPDDYMPGEEVYGTVGKKEIENSWDGYSLTGEQGEIVKVRKNDKISLSLGY